MGRYVICFYGENIIWDLAYDGYYCGKVEFGEDWEYHPVCCSSPMSSDVTFYSSKAIAERVAKKVINKCFFVTRYEIKQISFPCGKFGSGGYNDWTHESI